MPVGAGTGARSEGSVTVTRFLGGVLVADDRSAVHDLIMLAEPAVYEARYHWTPRMGGSLAGAVVFVLIGALLPMPLIIRLLCIGCFGFAGVNGLAYVLSRKIAFRVDQFGVTLGGNPFRYRSSTRFFPWEDITKIVVWRRGTPFTFWPLMHFSIPIRYIGVQRRAGAPPISGDGSGRLDRTVLIAPVPGIAAGAARKVTAWRTSANELATAVAAYNHQVVVEQAS
jgi:hypothetical protein